MDKAEIRKQVLAERKALSKECRQQASKAIFEKARELLPKDSRIFVYIAMADEVQTDTFMKEYPGYAVPKCYEDGYMEAVTDFTELAKTSFGTMEPTDGTEAQEIDAVIVPGVAFSEEMDRIGYGAGYYDRFFERYPNVLKIAVCYDIQIKDGFTSDKHDVKMDYIVTEKRVLRREH